MDVGNNLLIASEQNHSDSTSKSIGGSVSVGGKGKSGSINYSQSESNRLWTDNQTTIIGRNSVDVDVVGNTYIKGAVLSNELSDGTDGGNLDINTGTLTYENIYDRDKARSIGITMNTEMTPTINYSMHDIQQTTKATIGEGSITIGGETADDGTGNGNSSLIAGLNRDINNSQEITKKLEVEPIEYQVNTRRTAEFIGKLGEGASNIVKSIIGKGDQNNDGNNNNNTTEGQEQETQGQGLKDTLISEYKKIIVPEGKDLLSGIDMIKHIGESYKGIDEGLKNMGTSGEEVLLTADKGIEKLAEIPYLGTVTKQITSPIEGVIDTFYEDGSHLYNKDGKTDRADKETKYFVNGIWNDAEDIQNIAKEENTVVRHNPSSGYVGDLIEAGLGKYAILTDNPDMIKMNRLVREDRYQRRNMGGLDKNKNPIVTNKFHSQATVIKTGASESYINKYGTDTINPEQMDIAVGPFVNKHQWRSSSNKLGLKDKNIKYIHDPKDPVLYFENPLNLINIARGLVRLTPEGIGSHKMTNPRYSDPLSNINNKNQNNNAQ